MRESLTAVLLLLTVAVAAAAQTRLRADVWADNWFAFYAGDQLIREDSVPISTERSFNAESFEFQTGFPVVFAFVVKDFKENDTGLEYIGSRRQQVGDGGLIAQFTDTKSGRTVATTDSGWKCLVIHDAPLDPACARETKPVAGVKPCEFRASDEPDGWKKYGFDDSKWLTAKIYSADEVGPKGGYDEVSWNPAAKFIWGPNLKTNNTVLCRLTVTAPLR